MKHGGAELQTRSLPEANPEWLASVGLPACTPSFDGNVLVELWNGQPTATSAGTLMGTVVLDYFQLTKNDLQPRWFNFYWRPPSEGIHPPLSSCTLHHLSSVLSPRSFFSFCASGPAVCLGQQISVSLGSLVFAAKQTELRHVANKHVCSRGTEGGGWRKTQQRLSCTHAECVGVQEKTRMQTLR